VRAPLLVALALSIAPYQCGKTPDPAQRREETPGEALWGLAEQFRAHGDVVARRATLEFLVARYPGSRFASAARDELGADGGAEGGSP
jgi:hypothetical protein